MPATLARLIYIACALGSTQLAAQQLKVTTSADADSNAARSFIMVQANQAIPHGIKHDAPSATLTMQIPFIAELEPVSANNMMVQWQVTIPSKNYGEIEVIS
ncbi:MAG TPA: hypothetical protein VFY78_12130, partial [Gammaproteobacteria bacterium]|nr:hypothetical protein [Gammaproteobacteria bacterium]